MLKCKEVYSQDTEKAYLFVSGGKAVLRNGPYGDKTLGAWGGGNKRVTEARLGEIKVVGASMRCLWCGTTLKEKVEADIHLIWEEAVGWFPKSHEQQVTVAWDQHVADWERGGFCTTCAGKYTLMFNLGDIRPDGVKDAQIAVGLPPIGIEACNNGWWVRIPKHTPQEKIQALSDLIHRTFSVIDGKPSLVPSRGHGGNR